ncbi:hypothetical protein ACFL1D_01910 [Candidatus Omnitrophota bacterium]
MLNPKGHIMKLLLLIILISIAVFFFILKPQPPAPKETPLLKLMGTNWREGIPVAIINATVLKEGDLIEGYRVIKIEESSVTLSRNLLQFKLTFEGLSSSSDIRDSIRYWQEEIGKNFEQIKNKISSLVLKLKERFK